MASEQGGVSRPTASTNELSGANEMSSTQTSRKRLPSGSSAPDLDGDARSGQRKFPKEASRHEEDKEMDLTENIGLPVCEGNGNQNQNQKHSEGATASVSTDARSGTGDMTPIDFEALYNHCKGEQSLLSQLNKMSDILKNSNLVGTDAHHVQHSLSLTPLVKTLFTANEGISTECTEYEWILSY